MYALDIATEVYIALNSMSDQRVHTKCYFFDLAKKLLVAGGFVSGWTNAKTAEIYDVPSGTWSNAKELPNADKYWLGVQIQGHDTLYMFQAMTPGMYYYDLIMDEWVLKHPNKTILQDPRLHVFPVQIESAALCHLI